MTEATSEKRDQVVAQCEAVAHLCDALGDLYRAKAKIHAGGHADSLLDLVGNWSAGHMETLGDILNGMDAVTESDDWLRPIFAKAQEMWPQSGREFDR